MTMTNASNAGSRIYTPTTLKLYDWWVLTISNTYAWRCSTDSILLEHFQQYAGKKHMDIGVGTGYYLSRSRIKPESVTLVDLNPDSLKAASDRITHKFAVQSIQHDIFRPLPAAMDHSFDSVSMFYLLHCLPGDKVSKETAIANAAKVLKADGVLYGATILGAGVTHNKFGSMLMKFYNRKGIFNNEQDSANDLCDMLKSYFEKVDVNIFGTVAIFSATGKTE